MSLFKSLNISRVLYSICKIGKNLHLRSRKISTFLFISLPISFVIILMGCNMSLSSLTNSYNFDSGSLHVEAKLHSLITENALYRKVKWSPDNRFFAIMGCLPREDIDGNGNVVKIFDAKSKNLIKKINVHGSCMYVSDIEFSPDGKMFAIGTREIAIYSTANWELIKNIVGPTGGKASEQTGINSLHFSNDNKTIYVYYDNLSNYESIKLKNAKELLENLKSDMPKITANLLTDIHRSSAYMGFEIETENLVWFVHYDRQIVYRPIAYSLDGTMVAITYMDHDSTNAPIDRQDVFIEFRDTKIGKSRGIISYPHSDFVMAMNFTRDSKYLITGTSYGVRVSGMYKEYISNDPIRIWDTKSLKLVNEFTGSTFSKRALAMTPNDKILVSLERNRNLSKILLWDFEAGKFLGAINIPITNGVAYSLDISPDGNHIIASIETSVFIVDISY